ncbi:MAG: ECF transporter S component [Oscillospiraceae bacterium]|nr:ECF transporter S component [Oscillospiraceae bacterium]
MKKYIKWLCIAGCIPLTVFFPRVFGNRGYYLAAFIFCLMALGSVFASFEASQPNSLKLSVIAVLCALAIAGRAVFAAVPGVKPVAAIIIITGASLGPQAGFMRGAVTMLVSNFMFGQGPWTVWQMLAFGIAGMLAGFVFYRRDNWKKPAALAAFGFVEYMLVTGPVLDLSGIFAYTMPGRTSLSATLLAGLPVNLTAAVSTAVFMMILAKPIMKKLDRLIIKYGLD